MSAATFKILKQCQHCGNMFEAQKVSTKYCSHKCAQKNYKLRKKLERKGKTEQNLTSKQRFRPAAGALGVAFIKEKEFLNVREVATLLGCSRPTVYAMIKAGTLPAVNLNKKKTILKRSKIDQLFDTWQPK